MKLNLLVCISSIVALVNAQWYPNRTTDECTCSTECFAFGDPHVASFDGKEDIVECLDGSTIILFSGYDFLVSGTCAGTKNNKHKGWLKEIAIEGPSVSKSYNAKVCEDYEASHPEFKKKRNTNALYEQVTLYNPDFDKTVVVSIACTKKQRINMLNDGVVQNTVFGVHVKFEDPGTSDYSTSQAFLFGALSNGVSGKCLPFDGASDQSAIQIKSLKTKVKKKLCGNIAMTYSNALDSDCAASTTCNDASCKVCYIGNVTEDVENCYYCIKSTDTVNTCTTDSQCCSKSCVIPDGETVGECGPETSSDQIPPQCCDTSSTCQKVQDGSSENAGTCSNCTVINNQCNVDEDCCTNLKCDSSTNTCQPFVNVTTCSCEARCHAVADPVIRTFAGFANNHQNSERILYEDTSFGTSGLKITFDAAQVHGTDKLWITEVFSNGESIVSVNDCPVYELSDLPSCTKKKCRNVRDQLEDKIITESAVQNLMINGIVPFQATEDVTVEVHCVSKRRIRTGIPDHEYTRLDVYVNKKNTFVQKFPATADQNLFMVHELGAGNKGLCLEPFSSNTAGTGSIINGWKITDKISPDECTCGPLDDTRR